jgi:hypothetical protein
MDFPAFVPSSRNYNSGDYAVRTFRAQSGAESRILYGDTRFGATLELQYQNVTDKNAQTFVGHYENVKGTYGTFTLPLRVIEGWDGSVRLLDRAYKNQRNTTATYTDQQGQVQTAEPYETRFQFDGLTGASSGLLLEEAAGNSALYSETFASPWVTVSGDLLGNSGVLAPDGATEVKIFEPTSTGGYIYQSFTFTQFYNYTFSVYVKLFPSSSGLITIRSFTQLGNANFNLRAAHQLVSVDGTCTNAAIEPLADGWYRLQATFLANANGSNNVGFPLLNPSDGSIYIWGAQLENASAATSYIPTTNALANRAPDRLLSIGSWRYAEPPDITNVRPGVSNARVRLISVV